MIWQCHLKSDSVSLGVDTICHLTTDAPLSYAKRSDNNVIQEQKDDEISYYTYILSSIKREI